MTENGEPEMETELEKIARIAEEGFEPKGTGKGGKKKKRQGKWTLGEIRAKAIAGSKENVRKRLMTHPEMKAEINVGIEENLERLLRMDEKEAGLPNLDRYFHWILGILEERDTQRSVVKECEVVFFNSGSGPGGQNRNKVETSVRIQHLPTGLKFEEKQEREQARNREKAEERMGKLVEEHIDRWLEIVTAKEDSTVKSEMRRVFGGVIKGRFDPGKTKELKEQVYGRITQAMAEKK